MCHVGTAGHKVEILINIVGFHLCNSNHVVRELILLVCLTCGKLPKACVVIDCGTKMLRCLKIIGAEKGGKGCGTEEKEEFKVFGRTCIKNKSFLT